VQKDPFEVVQEVVSQDAKVVFDVGAERGRYSTRYLRMFPEARVYAFEPAPVALSVLRGLERDEERLEVVPAAVCDVTGKITFHVGAADVTSSLLEFMDTDTPDHTETQAVTVMGITVDDFCQENDIDYIDLLKLDVQGAEMLALRGTWQMIRKQKVGAIFTELLYYPRYRGQCWHYEVSKFLNDYGYRLHSLFPTYKYGKLLFADGVFVPWS
jgi:FkbM family methyltransferase